MSCTAEIITSELGCPTADPAGASVSHATRPGLPAAGQPARSPVTGWTGTSGRAARAVVYLARDERLRRQVALKVMAPDLARDAGFRTRMISESRAAAALDHPHILPVYEADEADGTVYVAMRYATRRGRAVAAQPARAASARLCLADRRPDRVGAGCGARARPDPP